MQPIREITHTIMDGEVVRYKFGDGGFSPEISASRNMVAFSGGSMAIKKREDLAAVIETLLRAYVQYERLKPNQGTIGRIESLREREVSQRVAQLLQTTKKQIDQRVLSVPCMALSCCWHQEGEDTPSPTGRTAVNVCCGCGDRLITSKELEQSTKGVHGKYGPKELQFGGDRP